MSTAKSIELSAAADYMGNGAVEVPVFESEIIDILRRSSIALRRLPEVPATGDPHRYFEQLAIATANSVDPRNISATASGPTRAPRSAFVKAEVAQTNFSLFDKDVTQQQGQFATVVAKDLDDIISSIEVLRGQMLWTGADTSLVAPTNPAWVGGLEQITSQQATLTTATSTTSIVDTIKTAIAEQVADEFHVVRPSAIYLSPLLADLIDQEEKAFHRELGTMEVVAGTSVEFITTQAGKMPLIGDPYMPTDTVAKYGFPAPPSGQKNYYAVILMEKLIEIPYVSGANDDPKPRLFQLGLTGNLAGQYVAVKFDSVIFKGASYAHVVVCIQR